MQKSIDILLATYNGEKFLREQINSVLNQTYQNFKLIIHDDGSSDNTVKIIKEFCATNPEKIVFIEDNIKTGGAKNNFSHLLNFSNADLIMFCDQDDVWKPNKVKILKKYLMEFDLVLSDAILIDESGNQIKSSYYGLINSKKGLINNIVKNSYLGCAMAFNKKILKKALPIPKNIPLHDWWIGLIGEIYGRTHFVKDKLIYYRRHNNNFSFSGEKSKFSLKTKIIYRLNVVKNLISQIFKNLI